MWTTQASEKGTEESNVVNIGISNAFLKIHEAKQNTKFQRTIKQVAKRQNT